MLIKVATAISASVVTICIRVKTIVIITGHVGEWPVVVVAIV